MSSFDLEHFALPVGATVTDSMEREVFWGVGYGRSELALFLSQEYQRMLLNALSIIFLSRKKKKNKKFKLKFFVIY